MGDAAAAAAILNRSRSAARGNPDHRKGLIQQSEVNDSDYLEDVSDSGPSTTGSARAFARSQTVLDQKFQQYKVSTAGTVANLTMFLDNVSQQL